MRATELFAAIKAGDLAAVERALTDDRSLVNARDETGLSPVLAALYRGKDEIASAILHRGPSLSVFEAAAAGDVAIADGQGKTPVDIANDRGNAEVALLLRRP